MVLRCQLLVALWSKSCSIDAAHRQAGVELAIIIVIHRWQAGRPSAVGDLSL
jgi:hypothetical protein